MCAGACVCRFSRIQKGATLSTTEAGYVALADPIKEAMFIRYVRMFIFFLVLGHRVSGFSRITRGRYS